ncbi:hypothetical protein ACVWW7_006249 [Bradyrhizobium sp. LM6.9]
MQSPAGILSDIWTSAGGDAAALARVRLTGEEPQIPSSFRVAVAGQTTIAAAGLAAAEIWRLRSGEVQDVSIDMRHAVAECRSERYLRVDDKPPPPAWDAIAGVYRTGDNQLRPLPYQFPASSRCRLQGARLRTRAREGAGRVDAMEGRGF